MWNMKAISIQTCYLLLTFYPKISDFLYLSESLTPVLNLVLNVTHIRGC